MEQERQLQAQKRDQERNYLKKMLVENEINKKKAEEERLRERELDIAAQEEHAKILEKQEQDRQREFLARERRAQEFMNRMGGTVIKNQTEKQREEDQMLIRYEMDREMRLRAEEQRKADRAKAEQEEMRKLLAR